MKKLLLALVVGLFGCWGALAEVPTLTMPIGLNIEANGLRSLAFVVGQSAVSPEVQQNLRYYLTGGPADNPASFDDQSRIFYWRPRADQLGNQTFDLAVKDPVGQQDKQSVVINVLPAPTLEALPKGWDDFKLGEKYLRGLDYFPSSNIWEAEIAASADCEIEFKVRDAADLVYTLTYLPKEGNEIVSKNSRSATIMLGAQYRSESPKKVRRDLYEDLFNYLDTVLKNVESVKIRGHYLLNSFLISDKPGLLRAAGTDNVYLPKLNISFDDRYYEDTLYSKKEPMLISDMPVVKVDFNTSSGLVWRRARLLIDKTEYSAAWGDFSMVVVKPYKKVSTFDVDYALYMLAIPSAKKLPFGEHLVVFEMENAYGQLLSREVYARVVTLPTQLEGTPMAFPNPFNPSRNTEVKVQYRLSQQGNIELVVFSGDGSTIMKKRFASGEEGGKKGLNTVSWDGRSDSGLSLSNGIYIGVIIDKDENRILDKFRLTVFR